MQNKPLPTRSQNIVLAIDPGFDRLGVAVLVIEKGQEVLLFSECISTNPKIQRSERLLDLGLKIRKIIKKWKPNVLAIETLYFNQNISSAMGVSEARGVIIFEAASQGLHIFEYGPQEIKVAVTGYGRASKPQVESMVKRLIKVVNIKKKIDDEIDAIAVGITHLASQKDF
jgi:crossover junction endodeoxyribonuclease RuvC